METLTIPQIRNVDAAVKERLRLRAVAPLGDGQTARIGPQTGKGWDPCTVKPSVRPVQASPGVATRSPRSGSRPTIMLSVWRLQPRIAGPCEGDRSSVV